MKKLISVSSLLAVCSIGILLGQPVSRTVADDSKPGDAPDSDGSFGPDVITALTDEETQQRDRLRPKYLQPTPVSSRPAETLLPLRPIAKETIAFVGNGLAERMEHHNFFEASLQKTFPDQELTFRNLGFPGHTPGFRPEAGRKEPWAFPGAKQFHPEINAHYGEGHYPAPDEWLTIVKASTIVAFFGFNESFAGEAGLENFKNELRAFVDHTLSRSYVRDGKAPRLVLATPIATEHRPEYILPDAGKRNAVLRSYANAIGEVAAEKRVGHLDLFSVTQDWFANSDRPLTINGVHLSQDGYRKLAPVIMHGLFGEAEVSDDEQSLLHQAIADKAWFWRNDYRMLNGVHAYGRRWAPYGNFNYPEEI
ncbi:MAG: SGNH/GDSL hydrolase family protein, partial [Planctomycetota bacterium]